MSGFDIARCRSCSAAIVWCETTTGKRMPVDAAPSSTGTLSLEARPKAAPLAAKPGEAIEANERAMGRLYTSHFATCPDAVKHRKPRAS